MKKLLMILLVFRHHLKFCVNGYTTKDETCVYGYIEPWTGMQKLERVYDLEMII